MTLSLALALLVLGVPMQGGLPPVASPPAAPVVPALPAASAISGATADVWLVIYSVLPHRTAEFEDIARQVREALVASKDEVRRAQGRDLRIHRSALPNVDGRTLYFLQIPALLGDADRSGFDVLIESLLPQQATALKQQLATTLDPANPSGNTYLISVR